MTENLHTKLKEKMMELGVRKENFRISELIKTRIENYKDLFNLSKKKNLEALGMWTAIVELLEVVENEVRFT